MKVYDISRPISPQIAVWPGDRPYRSEWTAKIDKENPVNVGGISMSTHTGTHADAPLHFSTDGVSIDKLPLGSFVGPVVVLDVGETESIGVQHVHGVDFEAVSRILFKTPASEAEEDVFQTEFSWMEPELIRYLGRKGVVLVGTDAPSVDPFDSKALPAHAALAECGIVNLENLFLRHVAAGLYRLIALPLRLVGLDASPVRAVLIE